ncbi:MAG: hypothetical protein H7Y01_08135 [Ferruginibacter sp.]|nr:hypothetical protein [Chitinophagaceae bacterium]
MLSLSQIKEYLQKTGVEFSDPIAVYRVLHLLKNEYYNIVVIQDMELKSTRLYIINDTEPVATEQSANVRVAPFYQKPEVVIEMEKESGNKGLLVWRPCLLSYSPFYPFWQINEGQLVFFANSDNKIFNADEISGFMHG